MISRRRFCTSSALAFAAAATRGFSRDSNRFVAPDLEAIDRHRILEAANHYLREKPVTITAYSSPRSSGGKHDYFSEGDYWWPDPQHPDGPYIQRDGLSNPDNF